MFSLLQLQLVSWCYPQNPIGKWKKMRDHQLYRLQPSSTESRDVITISFWSWGAVEVFLPSTHNHGLALNFSSQLLFVLSFDDIQKCNVIPDTRSHVYSSLKEDNELQEWAKIEFIICYCRINYQMASELCLKVLTFSRLSLFHNFKIILFLAIGFRLSMLRTFLQKSSRLQTRLSTSLW